MSDDKHYRELRIRELLDDMPISRHLSYWNHQTPPGSYEERMRALDERWQKEYRERREQERHEKARAEDAERERARLESSGPCKYCFTGAMFCDHR